MYTKQWVTDKFLILHWLIQIRFIIALHLRVQPSTHSILRWNVYIQNHYQNMSPFPTTYSWICWSFRKSKRFVFSSGELLFITGLNDICLISCWYSQNILWINSQLKLFFSEPYMMQGVSGGLGKGSNTVFPIHLLLSDAVNLSSCHLVCTVCALSTECATLDHSRPQQMFSCTLSALNPI